jgi:hypothetical protein
MTAPLPLRFYNPIKGLCAKVNLDYETVIGTSGSSQLREMLINAEIQKLPTEFKSEDRKLIKRKVEYYNRKYGSRELHSGGTETGKCEDKGALRYTDGLIVEHTPFDAGSSNTSETSPGGLGSSESSKPAGISHAPQRWVPGRGVINDIGLD